MKAKLLPATVIILISLLFTSCGTGESYEIRMRMTPGDKFHQYISMKTTMEMGSMPGMKMATETGAEFEVISADKNGGVLKMTYLDMNTDFNFGTSGVDRRTDSLMKAANKLVSGKSILLTVNNSQIEKVSGFDELQTDSTLATSKRMFTAEAINTVFGYMFDIYPGKAVKKGNSWRRESVLTIMNMKMNILTTYKLSDVQNGVAEIEAEGTISLAPKADKSENFAKMNVSGKHNGKYSIKLDDGTIKNGKYEMTLEGKLSTQAGVGAVTIKGTQLISDKPF